MTKVIEKKKTKKGICPFCENNLIYGDFDLQDKMGYLVLEYKCICPVCNKEFKEWYNLVFIKQIINK